jgi:hypothetical protein
VLTTLLCTNRLHCKLLRPTVCAGVAVYCCVLLCTAVYCCVLLCTAFMVYSACVLQG